MGRGEHWSCLRWVGEGDEAQWLVGQEVVCGGYLGRSVQEIFERVQVCGRVAGLPGQLDYGCGGPQGRRSKGLQEDVQTS